LAEWRVHVQGDQLHLETLRETLANYDPSIIREGNDYYLISKEWNQLDDARTIHNRAEEFVRLVENAHYLHSRDIAPLTIGAVVRIDDDGRQHHVLIAAHGTLNVNLQPVRLRATGTTTAPDKELSQETAEHQLIRFLRAAQKKSDVRDAQRFYRKGDWNGLYKAYELVRDDVNGEKQILSRKWILRTELKRFTQMAQSRAGLGDDARHASKKYTRPAKPMSLLEAKEIIGKLLRSWIDSVAQ